MFPSLFFFRRGYISNSVAFFCGVYGVRLCFLLLFFNSVLLFVVFIVYGVNARPLQTFFICIVKKQKEKINYGLPGTVIVEQV